MGVWCTVTELGPDDRALAEWSLRGSGTPSLEIVDCLARLHLDLQRRGGRLVLSQVCDELAGLIGLAGLHRELLNSPEASIGTDQRL